MRRFLRRLVKLAILVAVANVVLQAARRALSARSPAEPPDEPAWPSLKVEEPAAEDSPATRAKPATVAAAATTNARSVATAWVAPDDDGHCPHGYPVKVKLASGIYHLPGGLAYDRTRPDRCYATPQAAEADGYRAAKR